MIAEGVYPELSNEEYHGHKESISRSALMEFKKSPRKYWAKHLNPDRPPIETKPAWEFGTAFHMLMLEPKLFETTYLIEPEKVLLKDVGREAYELFKDKMKEIENSNQPILSRKDWQTISLMSQSVLNNEKASQLMDGAVCESSYFWKDEASGLMVKARPDLLQPNIYIDLKTIDDASPQSFQRSMVNYGYHIQAAMACDGIEKLTGRKLAASINICVEKTYPYCVGIYIIDEDAIDVGRNEYKQLLVDLKQCMHDNVFSDYTIQTIGLPKWHYNLREDYNK